MANKIVAFSTHRRNSILRIVSTKQENLENKCSNPYDFPSFPSHQLNLLIGLAFAAILREGSYVESCRYEFVFFIDNRNALYDTNKINKLITVISHLLENGFLAFKKLGYPYFYDDFIWSYHQVLHSLDAIPLEIKKEMQRILDLIF